MAASIETFFQNSARRRQPAEFAARGDAGNESDIDLMVIADRMSYTELYDVLQPLEASLGRSIHANLLTRAEWWRRSGRSGSFVAAVRNRPRLFILGSDGDLEQA